MIDLLIDLYLDDIMGKLYDIITIMKMKAIKMEKMKIKMIKIEIMKIMKIKIIEINTMKIKYNCRLNNIDEIISDMCIIQLCIQKNIKKFL